MDVLGERWDIRFGGMMGLGVPNTFSKGVRVAVQYLMTCSSVPIRFSFATTDLSLKAHAVLLQGPQLSTGTRCFAFAAALFAKDKTCCAWRDQIKARA